MQIHACYRSNFSSSDQFQPSKLCSLLISGYLRRNVSYDISGIASICLSYYGVYHANLIYLRDYHGWLVENNKLYSTCDLMKYSKQDKRINIFPFTQFIDPYYQIIYFASKEHFQGRMYLHHWSNFVAINIKTFQTHLLSINFAHCKKEDNAESHVKKLGKCQQFDILLSNPMTNIAIDTTSQYKKINFSGRRPSTDDPFKIFEQNVFDSDDDNEDDNGDKYIEFKSVGNRWFELENYKPISWNQFKLNLWYLFVHNKLFDTTSNRIVDQQILGVMLFIALIYFNRPPVIPQIILDTAINGQTKSMFQLISNWYNNDHESKELKKMQGFENFNFPQDCTAKIVTFVKNKMFECQCYMYIDWEPGSHFGCNQNLYQIRFKLEKTDNDLIQMFWNALRVQWRYISGIPYS